MMHLLDTALAALRAGISVIPIDHRTKRPYGKLLPNKIDDTGQPVTDPRTGKSEKTWAPYQERHATENEVRAWFAAGCKAIAFVAGAISGGLECVDQDVVGDRLLRDDWRAAAGDILDALPEQRTGSGGYQIAYRYPLPDDTARDSNQKLAWLPDDTQDSGRAIAIETRGEGGYFVVAPSLHPSGVYYELLNGSWDAIPTITYEQRNTLLDTARALDEMPYTRQQSEARAANAQPKAATYRANLNGAAPVIEAYNAERRIEDELRAHGYQNATHGRLIRPNADAHSQPGVVLGDADHANMSFHHSSNDQLNDGYWHTPFDVRCMFDFHEDAKAAVAAVAVELGIDHLSNNPDPEFDASGRPRCPNCAKLLRQSKNGHGWRCLKPGGEICYFWEGDDAHPNTQAVSDTTDDPGANRCTDLGNARRLVEQHGVDLRYVREWGWLAWDGRRWALDTTGEHERRAKTVVTHIYQEAADAPDHERAAIARHAIASQSAGKIASMISLAASEKEVRARPEDFDAQDWLLTCINGTIDLRSSKLLDHDRANMLTKAIDVIYDPAAKAPLWLKFLDRIFTGNADLIAYVQRMIGYMLTGSTGAQCMFIAWGNGANGKGVLINVIRALLGDYACNADPSTFIAQQTDRIRSDIARLAGVRFVSTIEVDEGRRLAEALVKQVTGGDPITAAFKYENEFQFMPRFKLLMATNHKPIIKGTDYAIWRRIRLIPFTVTIPENERDPDLADKLKPELPGILAWAVRGCLDWQRGGLQEPPAVRQATSAYQSEMDVIGQFLDDSTITAERAQVLCSTLYASYARWCENGGEQPVNQRVFGGQMTERGFERTRTRNGWIYRGIGIVDTRDRSPEKPPDQPASDPRSPEECDPCDPCDPNSQEVPHEIFTKELPGETDHLDHMDHTKQFSRGKEADLPDDLPAVPRALVPIPEPADMIARLAAQREKRQAEQEASALDQPAAPAE